VGQMSSAVPLCEAGADFSRLVARSRANVARSRRLCARALTAVARSRHLCPTPIVGASDVSDADAHGALAANDRPPHQGASRADRRSVLVLASDPVLRAFVADAISAHHDITEASSVSEALKTIASGRRIDAVIAGCFMLGEARGLEPCAAVARELYNACPWIPVAVIADTPTPTLKADVLLTGVRTFLPNNVTPAELAATVTRIARRPDAQVPTSARVAAVKQTFSVLEQAITDVPALTALAAMVTMSRSHFSRTFHAVAGISLRDYVRDLRLKRAQELMRASRLSLSAIALEAGFYDLPHFNKAFRHRFGMSPTQFRLASLSSHVSPAT
jgi:AraC-like DNA-binding protein